MKNFIKYLSLIFSIISIFLLNYFFISILLSFLSILLSLLFISKNNKRLFLFILIISALSLVTNMLIFFNKDNSTDIYNNENILLGSWQYYDCKYIFNSDYTYYIYFDSNNYCFGNYTYKYGGKGKNNVVIKQDKNYYYYNLILEEKKCTNTDDTNEEELVFAISKINKKDMFFLNINDNSVNKLKYIEN